VRTDAIITLLILTSAAVLSASALLLCANERLPTLVFPASGDIGLHIFILFGLHNDEASLRLARWNEVSSKLCYVFDND
jgi:hypothetical protein